MIYHPLHKERNSNLSARFFKRPIHLFFLTIAYLSLLNCSEGTREQKRFILHQPEQSGVTFQNTLTSSPDLNILNYIYYYNGAGVASADFNNDGLIDLYFTANQNADKLYLNRGNFKFDDITSEAGIDNAQNWTTGVTTVDINQDGFLDIYICKVGDYQDIKGRNLLYLNNGLNNENIPTFTEAAEEYGLDFKGFSTHATFFDYDLDGDLDVFLLNHSVNPNQNYGRGEKRNTPDPQSGDKLYENIDGQFIDVSEAANIIQSKIGYGLGVSVSDLNNDGYPDLYVGNDFFENDYLYLNKGDKTFEEVIQKKNYAIGHTTHFSMGNDIADLNNDGYTDILSLDMLPEDLQTYKTSGTEFNYQIYQNYIKNGYAHQYMHNSLQLNNGNGTFSETAYQSGIAATEWSWSPLIADLDNDGFNDVYVTNGIPGATNDMDFINFIANDNIQKSLGEGMDKDDMEFIKKIPEKKTINYFFKNKGSQGFENVSEEWSSQPRSFSHGSTYADLDNDGDLDLVVNNTNALAFILENTSVETENSNFVTIKFEGNKENIHGIGARVIIYADSLKSMKENYTSRGYLSSVSPQLHFGLKNRIKLDSIHVIWPDKTFESVKDIMANQSHTFKQEDAEGNYYLNSPDSSTVPFANVSPLIDFNHKDNNALEFNRDPLIPFSNSHEGPGISITDINNDGLEDIFICGAKNEASQLYLQNQDGSFISVQKDLFETDRINEDTDAIFFDADGDADPDLLVVSAGNEFRTGKPLHPRLYINNEGVFKKDSTNFNIPVNASSVDAVDLENDNDMDVLILSSAVPHEFGHTPKQHLFINNGSGNFIEATSSYAPELSSIGNCNSQVWTDLNGDGFKDLVVAGDWMPISIFINNGKELKLQDNNGLDKTHGFWNTVKAEDIDNDGDIDFVAGNWGANTRLKASVKEPIRLYRMDADDNGSTETIITYYYQGQETTLASKDELVKQLPGINKKYLSYADFASASIANLFSEEKLEEAYKKEVYILQSSYFENRGDNTFVRHELPFKSQISSMNDILIYDFNNDTKKDLLLVGNNFEISTQLSRLDASHGLLLLNDSIGKFKETDNRFFDIPGACRNIELLNYQDDSYLVIARNNDQPVFIKIKN